MQRAEKTPAIMEAKLAEVLKGGKFMGATQLENPVTGRIHYSIILDHSQPADTDAKVFREGGKDDQEEKINTLLAEGGYRQQTMSVSSRSHFVTKTIFIKRK
jgi:hypothetical protein